MEVICLETKAFYRLVEQVVARVMEERQEKPKWISVEEAMEMLNITSKTTLQRLKNEGGIRFTQPMKKVTLFDRESILEYLDQKLRGRNSLEMER